MVSVLLTTHSERFSFSHMRDFLNAQLILSKHYKTNLKLPRVSEESDIIKIHPISRKLNVYYILGRLSLSKFSEQGGLMKVN